MTPGSLHGKKKIALPSDLDGVKVAARPEHHRGNGQTHWAELMFRLRLPEVRDAIERGVADEITFPWGSIFLFGIDKVVKYHMDVPLYTTVFTYNVNLDTYNSMSPAQKKVFDDHCTPEWASKVSDAWSDFEAGGHVKMKALADHEVYKLTDDQLAQWKKAVQPLHASWAEAVKKAGGDPERRSEARSADCDRSNMARGYSALDRSPPRRGLRPSTSLIQSSPVSHGRIAGCLAERSRWPSGLA